MKHNHYKLPQLQPPYQDFDHDNEAMQRSIPRLGDNFPRFTVSQGKEEERESGEAAGAADAV